jgi:hypothetical protein
MPAASAVATEAPLADAVPPDCTTARWNSPFAAGEVSNACTDIPPALSPMIVTLSGSPPKAATLRFTHRSAASWSSRP